jgi:hypothetical protein
MIRISTATALVCALWCSIAAAQNGTGWGEDEATIPDRDGAPNLVRINALQDAVADAWQKMPLTQRRAIFVSAPPESYGVYEERKSNIFKVGEKLITYVEPIGYTWTANTDGTYNYGIVVDFLVKRPDGKILGGKEKLLRFVKRSRVRNQELMLVLSLSLDAIDPGEYFVEYKLHDDQSSKESKFTQNFTIQR